MKMTKTFACATVLCAVLAGCASTAPVDAPAGAAHAGGHPDHDTLAQATRTFRQQVASGPDLAAAVEHLMREPLDVVKTPASLRYIDVAARRGHRVRAYRFADGGPLTARYLVEVRQIQGASNEGSPISATYEPVLVEFDPHGRVVSFMLHGLSAHEGPTPGVMLFSSIFTERRATESMTALLPRLSPSDELAGVALLLPED